ncbi:MAG: Gfo/Idh/MocA family oxidoreductase [Pirellulaceae bacterium]|nr:Gfo/Idh/MocA family oxidoreductase [Planctomycetales bacterium]
MITNRRKFLQSLGSATLMLPRVARAAANDRVAIAIVGIRGRGAGLARTFATLPDVQITHICDVNQPLLEPFAKTVAEWTTGPPAMETDLRRVLDNPSVDAIVVATPDHWHALATIWGCQAGKHVYVEKPVSHNVFEAQQMVAAARKYQRHVQTGTQSRSVDHYREAIDLLRNGRIGKVHMAKAWNSQLRRRVEPVADSDVPDGLNWNMWQGPAPVKPFNANRFSYGWRWLWDYGTGDMGNDGVHDLDIARWGLGVEIPEAANCTGDKLVFAGDIQETPDSQYCTFRFPKQQAMLVYEQRLWSPYHQEGLENGVAFYGTDGYMVIGRKSWKMVEKRNNVVFDQSTTFSDTPHCANFIAAIRHGDALNCDIEEGYRSTLLAHLGNLSFRVGRPLRINPDATEIVSDAEATLLLRRHGRDEFTIPDVV